MKIPKFKNEAEEADWLYAHRDEIEAIWERVEDETGRPLTPEEIRQRHTVQIKIRVFDFHIYLWVGRRCVVVPVSRFPRLANASNEELQDYIIIRNFGIHWPLLDEDLSIEALLLDSK